jgi:alpha-galactosidase
MLRLTTQLDGVQLDPGETLKTDWGYLQYVNLAEEEPLKVYLEISAQVNKARSGKKPKSGWCSWYYAFEDVTQDFVMENLEWLSSHKSCAPLDLFQLDDGYEVGVGDWFDLKDSFPDGLRFLSAKIREKGMTPGIWLAPFVVKRSSAIGQDHKDWVLRNRIGLAVNPGFLWDRFPYVLDITHPEVLAHVQNVFKYMVEEMKFEYLKLDFLYVGALIGKRHNPKLTRAQAMYKILELIRDTVGEDVDLLGCGVPLGSGIGIFDQVRIGPDVAPRWEPSHWGINAFLDREMGHPSARNSILTTINRLPLHQSWWTNDPDCLLLRSKESLLSKAEVQTLASVIALSGGTMMVSDHLPELEEERVGWLSKLLPLLPNAARAIDWFDTSHPSKLIMVLNGALEPWYIICLLNWSDYPQDLLLDLNEFGLQEASDYHVIDFWNERYFRMNSSTLCFPDVPAHGSRLLSLRQATSNPQWLGDTLHISQGLLVKNWEVESHRLRCTLESGHEASGMAWIGVPGKISGVQMRGEELSCFEIEPGTYRLNLGFEGITTLEATWV